MAEAFLSSEVPAFLSAHISGWPHGPWSIMILGSFVCIQPFCADTGGVSIPLTGFVFDEYKKN